MCCADWIHLHSSSPSVRLFALHTRGSRDEMGTNQSGLARSGSSAPAGSSSSSAPASAAYTSTARENDHWLTASASRVLDDAYVSEWHRKNDLFAWSEKERRRANAAAAAASSSNARGSGDSSSGKDESSELYEKVYAFLGPHFVGLQSQRLAAIVHEIAAQCEAAAGKSMSSKREAFIRRIHLALEAHRQLQAKNKITSAPTSSNSTAVVVATSNGSKAATPLNRGMTPQQEEELKKLPLSQQLSIRWLLSVLQAVKPSLISSSDSQPVDAAAQAACTALLLQQLLPLLEELIPLFTASGMDGSAKQLGVMEEVEEFLARAFRRGAAAITAQADAAAAAAATTSPSSSSSTALVPVAASASLAPSASSSSSPFPLSQVTSSLLALALSRSKLSAILLVLHPLLLAHARAGSHPELRTLEDMSMMPQVLLKRIHATEGPRVGAYLRGASQRHGSLSSSSGGARSTGGLVAWGTSQTNGKLGLGATPLKKSPTAIPEFY